MPSPEVATDDLKPEMSAREVADAAVGAIDLKASGVLAVKRSPRYDRAKVRLHGAHRCLKNPVTPGVSPTGC